MEGYKIIGTFCAIIMIIVIGLGFILENQTRKENKVYSIETNSFLEEEFKKQITHQLDSTNIIFILNKEYTDEEVDAFLLEKANELSLELANIIPYNNKVIYEFTNSEDYSASINARMNFLRTVITIQGGNK